MVEVAFTFSTRPVDSHMMIIAKTVSEQVVRPFELFLWVWRSLKQSYLS